MARKTKQELNELCKTLHVDTLWSWSRYHCYKQDTYEYFLKYVLHEPEDRTNSIYCVSGGNVHEIIEQLYTDQIKYEDMAELYEDSLFTMNCAELKYNRSDSEKNEAIADKYENCIRHFFKHHNMITSPHFVNVYVDNNEKMSSIKEYIKSQGINITGVKFGKSKAQYFMDKDENTIYQGIGSIKYCNNQIADELYELSKNNYDNFIDLLIDIINKTSVDDRQLHILTTLNFFSEFGKNKYLLEIINLYNSLGTCKTFKKDKIAAMGIDENIVRQCAEKETPKQYSAVNKRKLVKMLIGMFENKSLSVKEQILKEQEYLGNITYKNPSAPENMFYVIECKFYKDKTKPYLQLYDLKNGEYLKTKITSGKSFIENPFDTNNVIHVKEFGEKNKMKKINGSWVKTDETEKIVKKWTVY